MSTLKFNQWLNPDNSENYKCRAWVNFNGTGTVAIRASGNVSSVTDNSLGNYTVNFIVPFADVNYAPLISATDATTIITLAGIAVGSYNLATRSTASGGVLDVANVSMGFFR